MLRTGRYIALQCVGLDDAAIVASSVKGSPLAYRNTVIYTSIQA